MNFMDIKWCDPGPVPVFYRNNILYYITTFVMNNMRQVYLICSPGFDNEDPSPVFSDEENDKQNK
jgi:hypothetical protein